MYRSRTGNRTSLLYHRRVSRLTGGTTRKLLAGLAMLGAAALRRRPARRGRPGRPPRPVPHARRARGRSETARRTPRPTPIARCTRCSTRRSSRVSVPAASTRPPASSRIASTRSARHGAPPRSTLVRVGRLMVGAFQMSDAPGVNSVRVYGRLGGEAALLTTLSREGRPTRLSVGAGARRPRPVRRRLGRARHGPRHPQPAPRPRPPARRRPPGRLVVDRPVSRRADGARVLGARQRDPRALRARLSRSRTRAARDRPRPKTCSAPRRRAARSSVARRASSTAGIESFGRRWPSSSTRWRRVTRRAWRSSCPTSTFAVGFRPACGPTPHATRADSAANPQSVSVAATAERTPWALTFQRGGARWRLVAAGPVLP